MTGIFKKLNKEAILEVALGMALAIILIRLLTSIFSRSNSTMFGAENAEDMENLWGKGRARRAAKKSTRHKKRMARRKMAQDEGDASGRAGEETYDEILDDGGGEGEFLEMAEYYNSLSLEEVENMDDAEYAEYLDYLEMAEVA